MKTAGILKVATSRDLSGHISDRSSVENAIASTITRKPDQANRLADLAGFHRDAKAALCRHGQPRISKKGVSAVRFLLRGLAG